MDELEDRMYFPKLNRKISLKKKKVGASGTVTKDTFLLS